MKRLMHYFIIGLLPLMLTACGFHLRGTGEDKIEIKELSISAGDRYGELVKELRERLKYAGVTVRDSAIYKLRINEEWNDRSLSYANDIRGTDIGKTLTLKYSIYGTGGFLLVDDSLEARGEYIHDTNNIVANELQSNELQQQLRTEAADLLIDRLRAIPLSKLETLQQQAEEQAKLKAEAEKAQQKVLEERRKSLLNSIPLDQLEQFNKK